MARTFALSLALGLLLAGCTDEDGVEGVACCGVPKTAR